MKSFTVLILSTMLAILILITSTGVVYSQTVNQISTGSTGYYKIPSWIKNNAQLWANGSIGDEDFLKGIEYLINQTIIVIPQSQQGTGGTEHGIPVWIKNDARWWAQGAIGDDDFVKGMQFLVANDIIHVRMNVQSATYPNARQISLAFTEYPSTSDTAGMLTIMKNSLTKPYDNIHVQKFNTNYLDFPNQRHYGSGDSLAALQGIVTNPVIQLSQYYALDYDFEHWTKTPATEQANPVASSDAAASIAHNIGLKYIWGPDWGFMSTTYQQIHWQNVDIVKIQTGYMSRTISDYSSTLPGVIAYIKAHNPNIQVVVQNSLAHMADPLYPNPVDQYNKETDLALQYGATGISVVYLDPVKSGCSCFTLANLQTIVNHFLSVASRS